MEGMQAALHLTGVDTQKHSADCDICSTDYSPRPSAPHDNHCALISTCMRFRQYPGFRICALPELDTNWMITPVIKPLFL